MNEMKTYKLYVGGAFVRSESGRVTGVTSDDGEVLARVATASRKVALGRTERVLQVDQQQDTVVAGQQHQPNARLMMASEKKSGLAIGSTNLACSMSS